MTSNLTATEGGRDIVRKERRKELAFEHKTKWDLRRWRVQDYNNRGGFWGETRDKDKFSSNSVIVSVDYILSSQPKLVNTSLTLVSNGLQTELLTTVLLTTTSEYRVEK